MSTDQEEIWKKVKGYENYEISNRGNLCRITKSGEKPVAGTITRGYQRVNIGDNSNKKFIYTHQLVADAFLPKTSEAQSQIDHINTDRLDNHLHNLRRCTPKENANNPLTRDAVKKAAARAIENKTHAGENNFMFGRKGHLAPVARKVECINTGKQYKSIVEASEDTKTIPQKISQVCRGRIKATRGLNFKYI